VLGESGLTRQFDGHIADAGKPFHVSLVWTDAPGSPVANAYVNDLDLEVTVGGQVYKGNVFSGANSTTGGAFDQRNNVENVFLPAGASGDFKVRVIARNIAGDGVPNNGDPTDQDFALVISNAVFTPAARLDVAGIRWSDQAGDGVVDPGESIDLAIALSNSGTLTATAISGVVGLTAGQATLTNATSPYPDIAPAATATNSISYTFTVDPSQPCGVPLGFQQAVTYNGTQTFTHTFEIPVGAPSLDAATSYTSTDGLIAIPDNSPAGITSTIEITADGTIGDVDVRFDDITAA
jgi:hypothetical protein